MFEIVTILFCISLNAFLAGYETAFIAVSRPLVRKMAENGDKKLLSLLKLKEDPEHTLSVIQVGITFLGAFAAAMGGIGIERTLTPHLITEWGLSSTVAELLSVLFVTAPITYFFVVFGELFPKTIALRHPFGYASKASPIISWLSRIFYPVVILLARSTKALLKVFPLMGESEKTTPEYISDQFIALSQPSKEYVLNLFKLERTSVSEIFIPWNQVKSLDASLTARDVEKVFIETGHTRLPVLDGTQVIGILNAKEFFAFRRTRREKWQTIVRPSLKLYRNAPLLTSFRVMQGKHVHMAVVTDLNGIPQGVVTLEDILEEVVGDIYDEDDDGSILKILSFRI